MDRSTRLLGAFVVAALAACGRESPPVQSFNSTLDPSDPIPLTNGLFVNGDFSNGLNGWTVTEYTNSGLSQVPPTTFAQLNLGSGSVNNTTIVQGATETKTPAGLSSSSTLRVPVFGAYVAVVNQEGKNSVANSISQTMTTTNADVDPTDNKVHVRFAIAPVLENPGHPADQQPYFWVELDNVTTGKNLFYTFNYANQPGIPWKTDSGPSGTDTVLYTDWQSFDISPGPSELAVGDQVKMLVLAAGCSPGGHWGEVYVESFGPSLPGLTVTATAPQEINTGSTLTYTFTYNNGGTGAATNTVIEENLPAGTTFKSVNAPGATCTTPAVGGTGLVSCNVGTVNPAASGSFTVTVNVTASSGSTISNGNYDVYADSVSAIIGPLVTTTVTSGVTYADLAITKTDNVAAVGWGQGVTYTIVGTNNGPGSANGATVTDAMPSKLTNVTWTCTPSGGATCTASGSGSINDTLTNFPNGSSVTYTVNATVVSGTGSGSVTNEADISPPSGVTDNNSSNNAGVDTDQIGTLDSLTATLTGTGQGTVVSSPAALNCTSQGCTSQIASFMDGTSVVLTATAATGNTFNGWSGGGCSGSQATCTVVLSGATTVTADFEPVQWTVTGSVPGGHGTVSCTSPVANTTNSTCTVTPSSDYTLSALTDNGVNVFGSVTNGSYTLSNVLANHTVVATFIPSVSSVALSANPTSSVYGESVTFTATVAGVNPPGTPTGAVSFSDGSTVLCIPQPLSSGQATCTVSSLAAGTHSVTASYGGDSTYSGSTSSADAYVVAQSGTSVSMNATPNPSTYAGSVTLTASVSAVAPGSGTPTGTVTFYSGGSTIVCGPAALVAGGTTCSTSTIDGGNQTLTAVYSGDANFTTSTSAPYSQVVNPAASTTVLVASPSPSVYGELVVFTATVSGPGATPTGTVTFSEGANTLCSSVNLAGGIATCSVATLAVGYQTVTASYTSNSARYAGSSNSVTEAVAAAPTTATVSATPNPSLPGQSVTFTATVAAASPGSGTPTGTVTFVADGSTALCSTVTLSSGNAACSTSSLATGTHSIVASYTPSSGSYSASTSPTYSETVAKATPTVNLAANPSPSVYGQAVVLTATVSSTSGSPTGTVTFKDGGTALSCGAQSLSNGSTTCTTSSLAVGSHALSATYNGDSNFLTASGSTSDVVGPAATTTTLVSGAPNPSTLGQSVTFTATVSAVPPGAGSPTGSVNFTTGTTVLCSAALLSGSAACTTSSLSVGTQSVTAVYSGDTNFAGSTSAAYSQTVNRASSSVAVLSSAAPSFFGQTVVFTATVTGPGATPTGTLTFSDGSTTLCNGVSLSNGAATCSAPSLTVATHNITASYSGDTNFSSSSGGMSEVVEPASTTTTLVALPNPSTFGQSVTLTASVAAVAPGSGTPTTGTVTFTSGASTLCNLVTISTGSASCTTSFLPVGAQSVVATYSGNGSFAGSASSALTVTVLKATAAVAVTADVSPSVFGETVNLTATVTGPGGTPTGTVTFSDGPTALCTAYALASGEASCSTSTLAAGTHSLWVSYSGDGSYGHATGRMSQGVSPAATTTTVSGAPNSSTFGQSVTFTATVAATAPGSGTPVGTVTFSSGSTTLCSTIALTAGSAACATSSLPVGAPSVVAAYSGSANFATSSSTALTENVGKATPTVQVATSGSPSVFGQNIVFTATVTGPGGTPTGTVTFSDGGTTNLCSAVVLSNGSATCGAPALAVATHTISVSYSGDGSFLAGGGSTTQVVGVASTTTTVSAAPNPSTFGQSVTFTATVAATAPGSGTPDGSVTFTDGGATLCSAVALSSGSAICTTSSLALGAHLVTASYSGSSSFATSSSTAYSLTVNQATPNVTLAADVSPSVFGQTVNFTATVSSNVGSPTGGVTFKDGSAVMCTAVALGASGQANCQAPALSVGSHAVTANYLGAGNFQAASANFTELVGKASTSVSVSSSAPTSIYGQSVTFTATVTPVAPGAGTPTGTVTFQDSGTTIGTGTIASGVATFTLSTLDAGAHAITAVYGGDGSFATGTSTPLAELVNAAPTAVTLTAAPNPALFGELVTFSALATANSPSGAVPSGSVQFLDGTKLLGTVTLDSQGHASYSTSSLVVGIHPVTAALQASSRFAASTSPAVQESILHGSSSVTVSSSLNPATYGDSVTFTAAVSAIAPAVGIPTGVVSFLDGATVIGTGTLGSSGTATLTTSSLAAGPHTITVSYPGDAGFSPNVSAGLTQAISLASSTVALASAPAPSVFGQSVTFTVTVTSPAGTPTGSVSFADGVTALGSGTLNASGVATLTTTALAVGSHPVVASYPGDANHASGTSSTTQLVNKAIPTLSLAIAPSPAVSGQPVTLTATVTVPAPGAGTPTGTITFYDNGTAIGTGTLGSGLQATFTLSTLAPGGHTFTASYGGDSSFQSCTTSGSTAFTVQQGTVSVSVSSSATPAVFGQPVTFTVTVAAVAPAVGTPTGLVTLTDGTTNLASLALSGGTASTTTTSLSVSSHPLTASYAGDSAFKNSSGNLSQVVGQAATSTALTSSSPSSQFGQSLTLTATVSVTSPGAGTPTGTVTFKDGSTVLGTGTLNSSGTASYLATSLGAGSHALSAQYAGDGNFTGSTGSMSQSIQKTATQVSLTATPSPAQYGQSTTLTALVSPSGSGSGTPTGTVTFKDGTASLGTGTLDASGRATLSVSSLISGPHALAAAYAGDSNFLASSGNGALTVEQGAVTVAVASSRNPSRRGRPVVFTATLTTPYATPTGTITFLDGQNVLGTGILANGSTTLSTRSLTKGTHPITVSYGGGSNFAAATGTLQGGEVVENTPPVAGSGTALSFDGSTTAEVAVSQGALDVASGTVELWVEPGWTSASAVTGNPTLIALGDGTSYRFALMIAPDRQHLLVETGPTSTTVPAALDDGAWHHLALISSAGNLEVLLDTVLVGTVAGGFDTAVSGTALSLGNAFLGDLDEVRIWSTAREASDLKAALMSPLTGSETGLIAYWRLDEGSGLEFFDSGPNGLDGQVSLANPPASGSNLPFAPSGAWQHRQVSEERPLTPVMAGYDADGDPLTLTVNTAAAHGQATADTTNLQVDYLPSAKYLGEDSFAFTLDDGTASSSYTIDVTVAPILTCHVDSDCAGGNICMNGTCTAPSDLEVRAGSVGGCNSGGGGANLVGWLLAFALLARRRVRRAVRENGARGLRVLCGLGLILLAGRVSAQTPQGFALQTYEPAPAGDGFFVVPSATVEGDLRPAAAFTLSWATEPLVLLDNGNTVAGGRIVHREFWGFAGGSLAVADRLLFDVVVPAALYQSGSAPFSDLGQVSAAAFGDLRLGGRIALGSFGPTALAAGLDVWVPSGSRDAFTSDGKFRAMPKVIAGREVGALSLGAELGVLVRDGQDEAFTKTGTSVALALAAAYKWREFRFGPELYGRYQFAGTDTSPWQALVGGHWRRGPIDTGLALGSEFDRAPGSSPFRVVAVVSWLGSSRPPHELAMEVAQEKEEPPPPAEPERSEPPPEPAPAPAEEQEVPPAAEPPPPAEPPAPPMAVVTKEKIEILQAIQFEANRAAIREVSAPLLEQVASLLAAHPEIEKVLVAGHTDTSGNAARNTRLSDERAKAVRKWLIEKGGIAPGRLDAKGFGSSRPIAPNDTPEGRTTNRRVEFLIVATNERS